MTGRVTAALVMGLFVLGAIVRGLEVTASGFPLNDGGLFYRMVLDLERTWPSLPETTSYNGIDAPFAYPPLAFYLGAALHGILGLDVMRFVPLAAAALTVPALFMLARTVTGSALYAVAATGAFALMPRSFEWMTMGGGLTRAPGLLFAILALWLVHRLLRADGAVGTAVSAGILGGMTALTHPQAALFVVVSGTLFVAWRVRERRVAAHVAIAIAVASVVILPWATTIVSRDQVGAILSASGTQPGPLLGLGSLFTFEVSGSRLFDVTGFLAAAGLVVGLIRGRWMVAVWLAVVLIFDSRGGATYATVPASLLAGTAAIDLILWPIWERGGRTEAIRPRAFARRQPMRALLVATLAGIGIADAVGSQQAPTWPAIPLTDAQRAGLAAVDDVVRPGAGVLVVTGRPWPVDAVAEWFPVLASRNSAATVQGHEWRGASEFQRYLHASDALRECADAGPGCLHEWSARWEIDFDHVYLPKGSVSGVLGREDCCRGLRELLRTHPEYQVLHDGVGATIFERHDG